MRIIHRTIFLIRHEKTVVSDKSKRFIGSADISLSAEGLLRSKELGGYFKRKQISGIYHSPLIRSKKTAELISNGAIPLYEYAGISEIHMGDWENLEFSYVKKFFPEEFEKRGNNLVSYKTAGGESFSECRDRAFSAFTTIASFDENIVIVGHSGVNRCILCTIMNKDLSELLTIPQDYGCINEITQIDNEFSIKQVNMRLPEQFIT